MLEEYLLFINKMFKEDLKEWKQVEREFATKLMKYDLVDIQFSQWAFKDWDLKATFNKNWKLIEKSYEVKEDRKAEQTWNVWIEYMYNWNPSWIYTSKADVIVYKIWDKFYYADRVRFIIELSKCLKSDVCGWDDDKSQMWLVKRDVFNLLTREI